MKIGHTIALAYVAHGNIYRALDEYSKILKYDPNDVYANYYTALLYEGLDSYKQAEKYYKAAIAQDSADGKIYYNYGMFLSKNSSYKKALEMLDKALEHSPYDAEILYDTGNLYIDRYYGLNYNEEKEIYDNLIFIICS